MSKSLYDLEFKESSAKLAIESDLSVTETARNLGINKNTLHGWVKKYATNTIKKPNISNNELQQELLNASSELHR